MSRLLLIDGAHRQETRVAVLDNGKIEDFDYEVEGNAQLRGNIYLAKVARVEPSLQAAFVDYGGNRHGFLAFDQIHPDYYNLTKEDREKLLEEAAADAALEDSDSLDEDEDEDSEDLPEDSSTPVERVTISLDEADAGAIIVPPNDRKRQNRVPMHKRYKIQDVIKRRQIILVQVVKEERGNKGAALSSYLSLAGRFSVLMPNTPRGGGISRKIANTTDRKRLREIVGGLDIPKGMGLIVRTAGAKKAKADIVRDYEYLTQTWDRIRTKTLKSMAPALVHQEGSLTFRAIRDMFDKSMQEVLISGDEAYQTALELAELVMPGQTDKIVQWQKDLPLFYAKGAEKQLESIYSPTVELPSGGYLVINQTEALVAIDVNSGKSTKQKSIEDTALNTNLEAATEACRQMRLRDLAGLIVIDFIDMEESRNNKAVEKRMVDSLKKDRARVQNSRISQFGLMEISRQRRRAGLINTATDVCPHCEGTGYIKSSSMAALQLLRALDRAAPPESAVNLEIKAHIETILYLLNNNRDALSDIEYRANAQFNIRPDGDMAPGKFEIIEEDNHRRKSTYEPNRNSTRNSHSSASDANATDGDEDAQTHSTPSNSGRQRNRRRQKDDAQRKSENAPAELAEDSTSPDSEIENSDDNKSNRRRRRRRKKKERPVSFDVEVDLSNPEYEIDASAQVSHAPDDTAEPADDDPTQADDAVADLPPTSAETSSPEHADDPEPSNDEEAIFSDNAPTPDAKDDGEIEAEEDDQPKRQGWWSQ